MKIKLRGELRPMFVAEVERSEGPQPWVTVVLPTKDRGAGAAACLRSLVDAVDPARTEVLLYAPREDPALTALLEPFAASATVRDAEVLPPGAPFCWSTLMNHAFRRARGAWILYASDDIVLQPGAVRDALAAPARTADTVGGIAFLHRNTEETYGGFFARFGYDTLLGERPFINFGLVRKAAYEQTAGFDERYRFYWADVDLCMQLQDAGFSVAVAPESRVEHVNVQDALRAGNADRVFEEDTHAFAAKWSDHAFFRGRNPLHKVRFHEPDPTRAPSGPIVIDAVIFQLQPHGGGISRLWTECLARLARGPLAPYLLLLDREGTCPDLGGLARSRFPRYEQRTTRTRARDARRVERLCRREGAALFVSTWFTRAGRRTPTALFVHDFIPEVLGWDLQEAPWRAKREALERARAFLVNSRSTHRDLLRLHPPGERPVQRVPCAAGPAFHPRDAAAVNAFRAKHGLQRPYFLVVGHRWPHKNVGLFLRAFARLEQRREVDVVFAGGAPVLEDAWRPYLAESRFHALHLEDDDLACAYAGALGLVFPSRYEGFGMPVLEALACACPVVTCPNSSLREIGGDAALYVGEDDEEAMRAALLRLLDPAQRRAHAAAGRAQAARYAWDDSARALERFLRALSGAG